MVHKPSKKVGTIVRMPKHGDEFLVELTLKTHDGFYFNGQASDFELATSEQYFSFVDGWLSNVAIAIY